MFFDVAVYETDLRIGADKNLYDKALELVKEFRKQIETWIEFQPEFMTSFDPVGIKPDMPEIVRKMTEAANEAGTGPMAAVAGAVSEMTGRELLKYSGEIIVENGGDLFIKTSSKRKVGIYSGCSPLSGKIALEIEPSDSPVGICTSSGTFGHSVSRGRADAVVIISKNTFLADAVATAACNRVKNLEDIHRAIDFTSNIKDVRGIVVIMGDKLGTWGDLKLVRL